MADLDSLEIKISADAKEAIKSVNNLAKAMERLNKAIDTLNIGKIYDFCNAVNMLAGAGDSLASSSDAVKDFAKAFKELNKAGYSAQKAKDSTDSLSKSTDGLSNASANMNELVVVGNTLATTFERLTSVEAGLKEYESVSRTFEQISGASQKLIEEMNVFDTTFREIVEPMNELAVVGNTLATVFERMLAAMSGLNEYADVTAAFGAISGSSQRLIEDSRIIDTTFREIVEPAEEAAQAVDGFSDALRDASSSAENAGGGGGAEKFSAGVKSTLSPMQKAKAYVKSLEAGFQSFKGTLKSASSHFAVFAKKTMATATGLNAFKKFAENARGSAKKLVKEITRIAKMLKLMVTRMVLRQIISGIGDGFKNLAQYSKEVDASISLLWNSFRQLGNSIAAAVSPLLQAFAPALNQIIQLCIKAVNAINQLISALTGLGTWKRAKTLTDSYAASLDKSNKSAKALKKTVLGFDELNQLQDNKNSGGGGTSPLDMFEEAPIDDKWKNWADKIKKMWETGDFTDLGKAIGKWLLDALNSIPWNKIKARAYKVGKSLATLLNGIIETPELGRTIGKSLAEAINTGVMLVNGFVRNFHWDSLGKFIGETFNGFFENIDWYYIKDTVVAGLRGLAIAIQNFIDTFNWDNISNFVINALDTLSAGIKAFFENIKWKDLGKKFGQQIKKILNKTNWEQVGEAIGDILQAAIDFAANALKQLSWRDVIDALSDLLGGFFKKVDKGAIAAIIGTVLASAMALGIGKMVLTAAGNVFMKKMELKIAEWLGAKAVANAAANALGGTVTSAAGSSAVTGAAGAAGASIGSLVVGGILEFLSVHALTNEAMKLLFPEDAELYGQYSGLTGVFKELKDVAVGVYDLIDMKLEESSRVHVELTDLQKQKLDELRKKAEETKGAYDKIYDTTAAEKTREMQERTDKLRESLSHIQDTKAAEGFANLHHISTQAKDSIDQLTITVEKDTQAIETNKGTWDDVWSATSWSEFVEALKNVRGAVDEDVDALQKLAKESREANAIRFTPLSDSANELRNSLDKIYDTKAAEGLAKLRGVTKETEKNFDDLKITVEKDTSSVQSSVDKINLTPLSNAADSMKNTVTIDFEQVDSAVAGTNTFMSGQVQEISQNVDGMANDIQTSTDTIKDSFSEDKWTFSGVWEGLKKTFENAKESIKGVWNSIADKLNGNHQIFGSSVKIDLPRFASGGFPENGLFMANSTEMVGKFSNGKNAVANNEQITEGIARAVFNAMTSAQSSGSSQYINNTIMVDGDVIARAVTKGQERLNRRYSPTMA